MSNETPIEELIHLLEAELALPRDERPTRASDESILAAIADARSAWVAAGRPEDGDRIAGLMIDLTAPDAPQDADPSPDA